MVRDNECSKIVRENKILSYLSGVRVTGSSLCKNKLLNGC